jgi:hypothetical protein
MKGNPLQVALRLHNEGYRAHIIETQNSILAYVAWKAEGDRKWITHNQYKLMVNLQCLDMKSNTTT